MGYCERCGGKFDSGDWYDRCGRCGDDDEWTMNEPHDKEKVKCAHCGTEIYKVRRYCFICGAKNDAAFKKGDSYCPHCGNAFENGVCPNCGKSRSFFASRKIAPIDSKYCAVCGEEVSRNDYFCMNCGNEHYINKPNDNPAAKNYKKPEKVSYSESSIKTEKTYSDFDSDDDWEYIESGIKPNLWLILGILQTVLLCSPFGIGTTIFAIHAKNCERIGKNRRARKKIKTAKTWFFLGITVDVLLLIVAGVIQLINRL